MKRKRDSITTTTSTTIIEVEGQELWPSFADLPSAITTQIFLQLPIKSVLICGCVCKTWNTLVNSDPQFAKLLFEHTTPGLMIRTNDYRRVSRTLHFLEYKSECNNNHVKLEPKFKLPLRDANAKFVLDKRSDDANNNGGRRQQKRCIACKPKDDRFGMVNSCNGLICLCDPSNGDPLVVCNPITGEFIRLPEAPPRIEKKFEYLCSSFGFQPKTNEYKVIRIGKKYVEMPFNGTVVEMHTVGTNTWRNVGIDYNLVVEMHTVGTNTWRNVGIDNKFRITRLQFPTCVNGALHWICFDNIMRPSIVCFNFESERFQSFPPPPCVFDENLPIILMELERVKVPYIIPFMGELRDSLYICKTSPYKDSFTMWVMKEYGVGKSWTRVLRFDTLGGPTYGLCWPIKHLDKRPPKSMHHSSDCIIYYEPQKGEFKKFHVRGTKSKSFEVISHIPSLISLKDMVKGDKVEVLNVHSKCAKFKLREENEVIFLVQEIVGDLANKYSSSAPGEEFGEEHTL